MKNLGIFALSLSFLVGAAGSAHAVYPVYPTNQVMGPQGQIITMPPGTNVVGIGRVNQNSGGPVRITGGLPQIGSAAANAGRAYYQPRDYERLADSGLYIGLSVGYSLSVMGDISADYANERDGFSAPGAFKTTDFENDTVFPLQISLGAAINNDFRADFSFTRYSGIAYPGSVQTADGSGGFVPTQVDGGAITANTTMLNVYYYLDSLTGYLAGGMLRPYIGIGAGISLNTIADYVVYDDSYYEVADPSNLPEGMLTGISDVTAYHNGGTAEQFAFMGEVGLTTDLGGGIRLDFFVRYENLGKVKTSGSIIVSQIEWLSDGTGTPDGQYEAPYDSVFHYTNWQESGRLSTFDLGARLRLQF